MIFGFRNNLSTIFGGALIVLITSHAVFGGTTPHLAYGTLQYKDGSKPASVSFSGHITIRPGEVLTHSSAGTVQVTVQAASSAVTSIVLPRLA